MIKKEKQPISIKLLILGVILVTSFVISSFLGYLGIPTWYSLALLTNNYLPQWLDISIPLQAILGTLISWSIIDILYFSSLYL